MQFIHELCAFGVCSIEPWLPRIASQVGEGRLFDRLLGRSVGVPTYIRVSHPGKQSYETNCPYRSFFTQPDSAVGGWATPIP
jgi:hypothetical protein